MTLLHRQPFVSFPLVALAAFALTACTGGEDLGPVGPDGATLSFAETAQTTLPATMFAPFTQTELDANWQGDRRFPTDGVTSVGTFGRSDVARIGIDSDQTDDNLFRRTEGIKTVGDNDFGLAVQVDVYLDPAWQGNAVRAGFWVVGDDGDETTSGNQSRDNWFGILEFVSNAEHEGWRHWDSSVGWTTSSHPFTYGQWVQLLIVLDPDNQSYSYSVDGVEIGTAAGGEHFIREAFLNSFNFGLDPQDGLASESYPAHWHAGAAIDAKGDCRDGAWEALGSRNQGQCIRFVETGKDSR